MKSGVDPASTSTSKPKISRIQKLRKQCQPPTIPAPTLEQTQRALQRTKSVSTSKLVRQAVKLERSAAEIASEFATEYTLKPEERRQCLRQVRVARMAQRRLSHRIRRQWKWTEDTGKKEFLRWLEQELDNIDEVKVTNTPPKVMSKIRLR